MTSFDSPIEIDVKGATELVRKGSRLIWVLGSLDAVRQARLAAVSSDTQAVGYGEIIGSKNPEKLVGEMPVLVCEHGITSLFLAQRLREKGIEAFSMAGGVDGMFKW